MPDADRALAERIADFIASVPVSDLQLGQARLAILDTVGVALAGGGERTAAIVRSAQRPGWDTDPRTWWDGTWAAPAEAALVNAVAAHALDYDCLIPAAYVQPGAVLIPGLIALAERDGLSGAQLLDGAARGISLLGALGRALGNRLHTAGWHPTTVLGVVAGAAAGAHLTGLPPGGIATSVNIAVALSGGLKQSFGSMTKELQVGEAARAGVESSLLARAGMTAGPRSADSWLRLITASGVTDSSAPDLELEPDSRGVHVKRYPCCGRMHAALDAGAMLRRGHLPAPGEVHAVACHLNPVDIAHIDRDAVRTAPEAKFSVQYCLARMLVRGRVDLSDFEPQELADADVVRFMSRVRIVPDEAVPSFGALVVAEPDSGPRLRQRRRAPAGATVEDVTDKFTDCCVRAGRAAADDGAFAATIAELDEAPDVGALVRSLPGRVPAVV